MTKTGKTLAKDSFVARHGLWTEVQTEAAEDVLAKISQKGLEMVRLSFADQHGILRGKAITASAIETAMHDGCTMTTTLLAKDTSHKTVYPVFTSDGGFGMAEMAGGGDFVMIPDPTTFRILPWADRTGWMLCDIYFPNGAPVPFSTRHICRSALGALEKAGYDLVSGLEVEFHLFRLEDAKLEPAHSRQPAAAPEVSLLGHGFQYLTEQRLDGLEPALGPIRRQLLELGLPLRSMEVEFGPSQCEFTFHAGSGLGPADDMVLFKSALKQICRRHGLHASFMCRPGLENLFSSGWHLHQSLRHRKSRENAFVSRGRSGTLSPVGRHYVAGLLEHAAEACVFTTPTINGYKRYQPYSLAPDRAAWAVDNRGVMIRVIGSGDDKTARIENRIGEPAANPYLYMASQIHAGLDGIKNKTRLGAPVETPYETDAPPLPGSLAEAVDALRASAFYRGCLGDRFVDYIVTLKQAEIARFNAAVTDWEHREYFDLF